MSWRATAWAIDQAVTPAAKLVLLVLADCADEEGRCWPSYTYLARKTGMSRRSIIRHMEAMETRGDLLTKETTQRRDGSLTSNQYMLLVGSDKVTLGSDKVTLGSDKVTLGSDKVTPLEPPRDPPRDPKTPLLEDSQRREAASQKVALPFGDLEPGHRALREIFEENNFRPAPRFWAKVGKLYAGLDLEAEGIKMVGWLRGRPKRKLNEAFCLNWLAKAQGDANGTGSGLRAQVVPPAPKAPHPLDRYSHNSIPDSGKDAGLLVRRDGGTGTGPGDGQTLPPLSL